MLDKQEATMQGKFFWYDVMTTDTKAAQKFYGDVVGWGAQDSGTPGADYILFTVIGQGVAGLMPISEEVCKAGAQPCWMGYIAVDNVDQAAAGLEREGGKVHRPPMDVPGVIRFSVVADPQGAGFIIAKGLVPDAPPPLPAGTPGTVGWHELYAADWKVVFPFWLDQGRGHRHGPHGYLSALCNRRRAGGRHDDQARDDPHALLGLLFQCCGR
jgi:uncharacterized protein